MTDNEAFFVVVGIFIAWSFANVWLAKRWSRWLLGPSHISQVHTPSPEH